MCKGLAVVVAVLAITTMINSRPQRTTQIQHFDSPPWETEQHRRNCASVQRMQRLQHRRATPDDLTSLDRRDGLEATQRVQQWRTEGFEAALGRRSINVKDSQGNRQERARASADDTSLKSKRTENGTTKILTGRLSARDSDIVFPGPKAGDVVKAPSVLAPKPCATGVTFCTNTDNYPDTYIEGILQNSANDFNEILGVDELQQTFEIGQRIDLVDEFTLCPSTVQVVNPKAAQNKDDKWLFVVNQPNYVQGVRVEVCQSDSKACEFSENFPNGYTTSCQQKYIYRKMLAIGENGDPLTDSFKLPSCCSCVIKNPLGIASRAGFRQDSGRKTSAIKNNPPT